MIEEKYFIEVYIKASFKMDGAPIPVLSLNPKSKREFERWEADVRACYYEKEYQIVSGMVSKELRLKSIEDKLEG